MSSTISTLLLSSAVFVFAPRAHALASGVLPPNTVAVVTTDGFFIPDTQSGTPILFIADSSFPGAPNFVRPAVQWAPRTDSFLVASSDRLFRVNVVSLTPPLFTIDDITPSTAAPMNLFDLDVNPGTGALYLLDQTTKTVERFQEPYAAGMLSDLTIPIPGSTRSIALDSRNVPPSLIAGETTQVTRVFFDGSTEDVSFLLFPKGVDQDPQIAGAGGAYMCSGGNDIGLAASSPNVIVSMNFNSTCLPLALGTEDIEWDPITRRAYVLAEDGTNPSCAGFSAGPNHVLHFPIAQIPGVVEPSLHTNASDSGITGTNGDLALVYGDFAFVTPYGDGCFQGGPSPSELDVLQTPVVGFPLLTVQLHNGPASRTALLVAGLQRTALPLAGGCLLLANPGFLFVMGTTDAQGFASLNIPIPAGVPLGTDIFLQGVVAGGPLSFTQGLMLHVGLQ